MNPIIEISAWQCMLGDLCLELQMVNSSWSIVVSVSPPAKTPADRRQIDILTIPLNHEMIVPGTQPTMHPGAVKPWLKEQRVIWVHNMAKVVIDSTNEALARYKRENSMTGDYNLDKFNELPGGEQLEHIRMLGRYLAKELILDIDELQLVTEENPS